LHESELFIAHLIMRCAPLSAAFPPVLVERPGAEGCQQHQSPQELVAVAESATEVTLGFGSDASEEGDHQKRKSDQLTPAAVRD
jgi:hypothetical protein